MRFYFVQNCAAATAMMFMFKMPCTFTSNILVLNSDCSNLQLTLGLT